MLLFFLGNGVLAFSGLSRLLGALYLPGGCSNSLSKRWLVRQSASISSTLAYRVSSVPLEVGYLRYLAGLASLGDWCGSCLCSELIPSVTERSALFVKELSFPQTAPN